jgi:transposase
MIHIGVDLHRTFCYVTALDANGAVLHQGRVNNQREALQDYLRRWPPPVRVVFEACSFWPAFVEAVESEVAELFMVHPQRVKAIASAKLKNDRVDSLTLAHLLRADLLPLAWLADRETRQRRTRTRTRIELGRLRTRLKNRVHAILHQQGLRPAVSDLFGQAGRSWLLSAPLPEAEREAVDSYLRLLDGCEVEIQQPQHTLLAATAVRTSPGAKAFFEHLCRRKPRHVARVALARKLLGAVYALLRDGVCFDERVFATM